MAETRLGIGLDSDRRVSDEGRLYTSETVSFSPGVHFLVAVGGAASDLLPASGLLRLGGDGRGAEVSVSNATLPWLAGLPPAEPSDRPAPVHPLPCIARHLPRGLASPWSEGAAKTWFLERGRLRASSSVRPFLGPRW